MISEIIKVKDYDPINMANPRQERGGLVSNFNAQYDSFYKHIVVPFGVYELNSRLLNTDIEKESNKIKDTVKTLNEYKKKAESLIEELQGKALEQTVSNYSQIFGVEAKNHKSSANKWLWIGWIAMVLFLGASFLLYNIFKDETSLNATQIIFKVAILVALLFIITFTFKQYSINKHLYTLNKHRENTLNSYKLFIDSIRPEDNDVRNAIMMQVSRAIYEQGKTGYISEKGSEPENPSIIEMIRTVQKSQ